MLAIVARRIFPERVLGKLSPNRISSGFAIGPISLATHSRRAVVISFASSCDFLLAA